MGRLHKIGGELPTPDIIIILMQSTAGVGSSSPSICAISNGLRQLIPTFELSPLESSNVGMSCLSPLEIAQIEGSQGDELPTHLISSF